MLKTFHYLALAILVFILHASTAHAQAVKANWYLCYRHLDWRTATRVVATECYTVPMPRATHAPDGWWVQRERISPHVVRSVRYPTFPDRAVSSGVPVITGSSYQQSWLVTYYVDSGLMADGNTVHWGAAACGYDVGEIENGASHNAHVFVPGVGLLECEDRIGFQPYHHVDVWGYHPGLGSDWRTVTVYP